MNAKILLISPYFYPHKGGSQQYAEELHATLIKRYPGVSVDVLTYNTDNAPSIEKYRNFTIYRVPCYQILKGQFALPNYFALTKTLKKLLKKNKYMLINSHTRFFETSWWTPLVAKYAGTKSVLTDHCAHHPTHTSRIVTEIAKITDTLITPLLDRLYDHVTVTNLATKEFVKSIGITIPILIYGGVDTAFFTPRKRTSPRLLPGIEKKFKKNDILVTFVGRMISSKGPDLALASAKKIIKKYPNIHFVFVGDGPLYKKLSRTKNNQIYFLGARFKKEIAQIMANSDILLHPSTHHEGFPNVLLEAASSGCAIIATDRGGTKEIISDSKNGLLVDADVKEIEENILDLIKSPKLRASLGTQARKDTQKRYDWKKIADQYATFIQKI